MGSNEIVVTKNKDGIYENDVDELKNVKGGDLLSQIQIDLINDVLYKILKKSNRNNEIITNEMKDNLKEGVLYSPPKAAKILNIPTNTMRGWITELEDYIRPTQQGRYTKLSPISIYKLRMITMLREENGYTIGHLKELTLGIKIVSESGEDKEPGINQKVDAMEKQMQEMAEIIKKQGIIIGQIVDQEAFKDGKILLDKTKITPMIEEDTQKRYEKMKETVKEELKEELGTELNNKIEDTIKEELDYKIHEFHRSNEENLSCSINKVQESTRDFARSEIKRLMEENKPKGLLERLFRKKK